MPRTYTSDNRHVRKWTQEHAKRAAARCKHCHTPMHTGLAIQQTYTGTPDFPGGEVVTMSPGGPGKWIDCLKCPQCGWSGTKGEVK